MTDFSKILEKARELESKMKESQEKIKNIKVEGVSGSNSVKVFLDGEGEKAATPPDVFCLRDRKNLMRSIREMTPSARATPDVTLQARTKTCTLFCGLWGAKPPQRTSPRVWGAAAPQPESVYISLSGLVHTEHMELLPNS